MEFTWSPTKADLNLRKHKVSFQEASTVFNDPLSVTYPDPDHSMDENRFIIIGLSQRNKVVVVSHTYTNNSTQIISARPATRRERKFYEQGS